MEKLKHRIYTYTNPVCLMCAGEHKYSKPPAECWEQRVRVRDKVRKKIGYRAPKAVCWHCQDVAPPRIFADMPCRYCGRKRERWDDVIEMLRAVGDKLTFSVPAIPIPSREVVIEKGEKLKEQMRVTALELRKSPLQTLKLKARPSHFLNLPLEMRLLVYNFLAPGYTSFERPTSHPFYPLLHVCHTLRDDIIYLFYHSSPHPSFTFFTPESCNFFLGTTGLSISLITDLTLHVPAAKTASLEPIFRKLYLASTPLRSLSIHLIPLPGHFREPERTVTAYMLPRRIGLSESGEQKVVNHPWGGQDWFRKEDFVYADTHSALAVRLAREEGSAMGRAGKELRCLRVFGQPKDGLDFELAVLKLELQMESKAASEGKQLIRGFGARSSCEKYWYYDVWIEGEVETDTRFVDRVTNVLD